MILTSQRTEHDCEVVFKAGEPFHPLGMDVNDNLEYTIKKNEELWLYSYFMCAQAVQEKRKSEDPNCKSERFWQNVHGFVPVSLKYETKINLCTHWDTKKVQEKVIWFYRVNPVTCELEIPTICSPNIMTYGV